LSCDLWQKASQSSAQPDNVVDANMYVLFSLFFFCYYVAQTHLNVEATPRLSRPAARKRRKNARKTQRNIKNIEEHAWRLLILGALMSLCDSSPQEKFRMPLTFWQFLIKQTTINAFKLSAAFRQLFTPLTTICPSFLSFFCDMRLEA